MKYLVKDLNVPAFRALIGVDNLLYGVGLPSESVEWSIIIYLTGPFPLLYKITSLFMK